MDVGISVVARRALVRGKDSRRRQGGINDRQSKTHSLAVSPCDQSGRQVVKLNCWSWAGPQSHQFRGVQRPALEHSTRGTLPESHFN